MLGPDARGPVAAPLLAVGHHSPRQLEDLRGVEPVALGVTAAGQDARSERDRRVRPLGGGPLRPLGLCPARSEVIEKLFRRRRDRRFGPGPPDVNAGVVVRAADPARAVRLRVDGRRLVQLRGARAVSHLPDAE